MTTVDDQESPDSRSQGSYVLEEDDSETGTEPPQVDAPTRTPRQPRFPLPPRTATTTPGGAGLPGFALSDAQFNTWLRFQDAFQQQQLAMMQPAQTAPIDRPRVGGANRQGYWTGFGLNSQGAEPRSSTACMSSLAPGSRS